MKVHCLGTTGFHPSPNRHTACYYVPDLAIVLDAGTGAFRLVDELLERPQESLTILLTHAHLDHVVGLTFLLDAIAVTALKNITLVGEAAKLDAVRQHLYHQLLFPVEPNMEFLPLPGPSGSMQIGTESIRLGQMTAESSESTPPKAALITWFPLEHPGGSVGYCLEFDGKKLAYVTDTIARPNAEYLNHIMNADLLLHECYFADEHQRLSEKTGHSWLSGVTDVVRKTHPKQTALIHINPLVETLGNGFRLTEHHRQQLKMFVAEDGSRIEF